MSIAFVFPGQGSQKTGMGAELADAFGPAREVFQEVDDALGQHLFKLMRNGPEDELMLTENAQPALMAVSLAVVRVLQEEAGIDVAGKAAYVAGHSLGEYSALAAANAISIADTARLLKTRGLAMQKAVPVGEGAMAALLGLDFDQARQVAEQSAGDDICQAANDNAPGQVVISGSKEAVERAIDIAKDKGARRAVLLPVSAPFHCALMAPAADVMAEALANTEIHPPVVPLVANVTATAAQDPESIRAQLVQQVTGMVRWRESVLYMAENGVDTIYELGAGKVLTGLAKRISRDLGALAVGDPAGIEEITGKL